MALLIGGINAFIVCFQALTNDIAGIQERSGSSSLVLFGDKAFPIALNSKGDVSMAAAKIQQVFATNFYHSRHAYHAYTRFQGRVVACGHHPTFFGTYEDMGPLVSNAVNWASKMADNPTIGSFSADKLNGFPNTVTNVPTSDLAGGT